MSGAHHQGESPCFCFCLCSLARAPPFRSSPVPPRCGRADVRYLSVCSGIEAASVAWHPLGWEPAAFCEIEAFPSAVLKERYPHVPNYGDFTRLTEPDHPIRSAGIDLLVGGTPCQAFSVAGLRRGLADPRGGLTLEFVRLAQALRPKWIVWENVPGVLSQDGGRAFGAFLGALGELGYGFAYRVLDAQYVRVDGYPHAVPQRRRRVFVVGCAGGDASRAAAVLLEPEGVRGDPPTRRATRQGAAPDAAGGVDARFWNGQPVAESLTCTSDDQRMPDKGRMQMVVQPSTYAKTHKPMSNEDAEGWSPQDHSPTITYWPRDRSDAGTDVAVVQQVAYSLSPGREGCGDQHKDDLYVAKQSTSRTLTTGCGSDPSHHQGGTVIAAHTAVVQPLAFIGVFQQSSMEGKGTVGFSQEDLAKPVKTQSDGQMVVQPLAFDARQSDTIIYGDRTGPLDTDGHTVGVCVIDAERQVCPTLTSRMQGSSGWAPYNEDAHLIPQASMSVRRLTPTECERLQGFPDGWTQIAWKGKAASECPDGPRYRALGNSMAVNVMRWIGRRIELVEKT